MSSRQQMPRSSLLREAGSNRKTDRAPLLLSSRLFQGARGAEGSGSSSLPSSPPFFYQHLKAEENVTIARPWDWSMWPRPGRPLMALGNSVYGSFSALKLSTVTHRNFFLYRHLVTLYSLFGLKELPSLSPSWFSSPLPTSLSLNYSYSKHTVDFR